MRKLFVFIIILLIQPFTAFGAGPQGNAGGKGDTGQGFGSHIYQDSCTVDDGLDDTACVQAVFDAMASDDLPGAEYYQQNGSYHFLSGDNAYMNWPGASYSIIGVRGGPGNNNGTQWIWEAPTAKLDSVKAVTLATVPDGASCAGAPTVNFSGGGGSGVTATALMGAVSTDVDHVVIELADQGSGYTSAPTIDMNNNSCTGIDATPVMQTRKPVLRLIAPQYATIKNITIQANTDVAAGIVMETADTFLTTSNEFENVSCQGVTDNIGKCIVIIDGDQSAINYPSQQGPTGAGPDGNNDAHSFKRIKALNYCFAAISAEMSQALGMHVDLEISDAADSCMEATYAAMLADGVSGDFTGSTAYDTKLGPYAVTTLHALGGGQPLNGGNFSYITGGAWHRHAYDLALAANRATEVNGIDIEGSARFLLMSGKSENTAPCPMSTSGVNWTNSATGAENAPNPNAIINLGCAGPFVFEGNTFQGLDNADTAANSQLIVKAHGKSVKLNFSHNQVRWRGNDGTAAADQSVFNANVETPILQIGNHYRTNAGGWTQKDDERNNPHRIHVWNKTVAPTVNDDIDQGYIPGSMWLDATANQLYVMESNANGAAVWHALN